ncbi:PH-domain-containing protein, partial [Rozella allomycis CSF55]
MTSSPTQFHEIVASTSLSVDDPMYDSPVYRASVQKIEDEVDEIVKWLESIAKTLKSKCDDEKSRGYGNFGGDIDGSKTVPTIKTISQLFGTLTQFKKRLATSLEEQLYNPLAEFIKNDIKELRESRKTFERAQEKYENALLRFSTLSKLKEASALKEIKEDAYQLYENRKMYGKASFAHCKKLEEFKSKINPLILNKFIFALRNHVDYYSNSFDILNTYVPVLDELEPLMKHEENLLNEKYSEFKAKAELSEQVFVEQSKPDAIPARVTGSKKGYLFKKKQGKGIATVWNRSFFVIENGNFYYYFPSKARGKHCKSSEINVLLCHVKPIEVQDRRFCFEVISSKKSITLQAESQEEMDGWIKTFERAKQQSVFAEEGGGEEEKVMKSKELAIDQFEKEEIEIEDKEEINFEIVNESLKKRNDELHENFKSVPLTFPCALQKDILLQGRIYLTQNRICFYSNILGFITVLIIENEKIKLIERKDSSLYTSLTIHSFDNQLFIDNVKNSDVLEFLSKNKQLKQLRELTESINLILKGLETNQEINQNQIDCGCNDHYDNKAAPLILSNNPLQVFKLLFSDDSTFIKDLREKSPSNCF